MARGGTNHARLNAIRPKNRLKQESIQTFIKKGGWTEYEDDELFKYEALSNRDVGILSEKLQRTPTEIRARHPVVLRNKAVAEAAAQAELRQRRETAQKIFAKRKQLVTTA